MKKEVTTIFTEKVQRKLIWQEVLERIRRKIILGEIEEGEHLKEVQLSNELGISRGPIREAIAQLEIEGLVHTLKNGRTKVAGFSIKDAEDLYFARKIIEKAAIEQMTFPLSENAVSHMYTLIKEMEDEAITDDRFDELDLHFHYYIIQLTKNKILVQMWLSSNGLIKTIMEITNDYVSMKKDVLAAHHRAILRALQDGDKRRAAEAIDMHVDFAKDALLELFKTIRKKKVEE